MKQKNNQNPSMREILETTEETKQHELYNQYVKNMTPKSNPVLNCLKAFVVGGSICLLGEIIIQYFQRQGLDRETAGAYGTLLLVLASVLLTGCNLYQKLGQFGGAGSIVPITGFANSVVAPAIEFHAEGEVFGVGTRIFSISGPVILYGILSSWILGIIYWIMKMMGVA